MHKTFHGIRRITAAVSALLLSAALLIGCTSTAAGDAAQAASDTPAIPETAAPAVPDVPPTTESYPFSFMLDDGTELEISMPCDPELWSELHLCPLGDGETPARIVIYTLAHGTDMSHEEARAFNGDDGTEYPVISANEILSRYVTIYSEDEHWRMTVGGAEYFISKAQFAEYAAEEIRTDPDPTVYQNYFVENGQLFCRVSFLCAGNDASGFAAETLKIRYDLTDGTVTAAEITFERAETES